MNEVFNFSVDKLYDLLFTTSPFLRDFMEQRRFSGLDPAWLSAPSPFSFLSPPLPRQSPLPEHLVVQLPSFWTYLAQELLRAVCPSFPPVQHLYLRPLSPGTTESVLTKTCLASSFASHSVLKAACTQVLGCPALMLQEPEALGCEGTEQGFISRTQRVCALGSTKSLCWKRTC